MTRTRIDHRWLPSPNTGERRGWAKPELLILHYTGMQSAEAAGAWLCNPASGVSCHYLVDEAGRITQMVDENLRAWHAGAGRWKSCEDINSASIGIEIHNPGHDLGYTEFPAAQIAAVIRLCHDILERNHIAPEGVLAHSDTAPLRKKDPGEKFPWAVLYKEGIGHWVAPSPLAEEGGLRPGDGGVEVAALTGDLAAYGYGLDPGEVFDSTVAAVVTAFQRHFRPERVDGVADASTIDSLRRLLKSLRSMP
jgi:N-acetylmuramoyl-L-alanine amidase